MNKSRAEELARDQKQHDLEIATLRAKTEVESVALARRASAMTPQLVEVLQRLGDEAVLQKLTEAVAPLAILGGDNVAAVLQKTFAATPAVEVLSRVIRKTVFSVQHPPPARRPYRPAAVPCAGGAPGW